MLGIEFISGLAGALFNEIKSNQHPTIEDLKGICKGALIINKISKQFDPVEYENASRFSSSAMSDILVNFVPRLSRAAKIFTDEDQVFFI